MKKPSGKKTSAFMKELKESLYFFVPDFLKPKSERQESNWAEYKKYLREMKFNGIVFLVLVIGVIALLIGYGRAQYAEDAFDWPTTTGKITTVDIHTRTFSSRDEVGKAGSRQTMYDPLVYYEYTVGPDSFKSKNLSYGPNSFHDRKDALAVTEKYAVGQTVTVYYKPTNPETAVVELVEPDYFNTIFLVGFAFAAASAPLFLIGIYNAVRAVIAWARKFTFTTNEDR